MRILIGAAALLTISTCLAAQKVEAEAGKAHRQRIEESIERMRRSIREGIPITTNVRVTIWLRNEHRLKGVVKGGSFVEKPSGLDFVKADKETPGAGIRVWYHDNTDSFIFLPFEAIRRYRIGSRLTGTDIEKILAGISKKSAAATTKRNAALASRKAKAGVNEPEPRTGAESEPRRIARLAAEEKLLGLLVEFPPQAGWGTEKVEEIERAKIVVGAYPDAESRRFLAVFGQWKEAMELSKRRLAEAKGRSGGAREHPPAAKAPK